MTRFIRIIVSSLLLVSIVAAQMPDKTKRSQTSSLAKTTVLGGTTSYQVLNINNMTSWIRADGMSNYSPSGNAGLIYPRGTTNAIYADGIIWGGKAFTDAGKTTQAPNQLVRVGGGSYSANMGTSGGRIIGSGSGAVPSDPNGSDVRVVRIRRDYKKMTNDDLKKDAADYYGIPFATVTSGQIAAVLAQYEQDWQQWPVQYGAPFIDRNKNGTYDPPPVFSSTFTVDSLITQLKDEPGVASSNLNFPADQVLWTVYNDLDTTRTKTFEGSYPLGLEVQVTVWGYKSASLSNLLFRRVKLINKGGVDVGGTPGSFWIDSMYVAQWSDPDLGEASNDLVGCDSILSLGYVYNAYNTDTNYQNFGLPPAAFGYDFFQGPIVPSPGDTAIFDLKKRPGFKNLGLTAFSYFSQGSPYSDPPFGNYGLGTSRWYKMLRGFAPLGDFTSADQSYAHPPGYSITKFPLSGDPFTSTGFLDGWNQSYSFAPGDRRMILATGPFSLAPGDTQEVVVALVGGMGNDRLSSLAVMKGNDVLAQSMYKSLFAVPAPLTTAEVTYPNGTQANVKITANASGTPVTSVNATVRRLDASVVTTVQLYDDGAHGDGAAMDGVFANTALIARERAALSVDITAVDQQAQTSAFPQMVNFITTAGPLELNTPVVFSDNLNNNGVANPGENVRFGFTLRNNSAFDLGLLRVGVNTEPGKILLLGPITISGEKNFTYNQFDGSSYFAFTLPGNASGTFQVQVTITDTLGNKWSGTLDFPTQPFSAPIINNQLPQRTGTVDGNFSIMIVDTSAIKNHLYVIHGLDSIDANRTPGFMLKDSTTGTILLAASPIPDPSGHGVPVTDGFKVLRGSIPDPSAGGMVNWSVPNGSQVWTWTNGNSLGFEGFNGAIGWNEPYVYFSQANPRPLKTLKPSQLKNTLIQFAGTDVTGNVLDPTNDPDFSFGYRYLRAAQNPPAKPEFAPFRIDTSATYAYQDYTKSVPFSAWDGESVPARRLMVGYLENNAVGGLVDGKFWPLSSVSSLDNTNSTGPREWFFIFNVPYSTTPDANLTKNILNNSMPVMWWGTPTRNGDVAFGANDEFMIQALHPLSSRDTWTFNPTAMTPAPSLNNPMANATNQTINLTFNWGAPSGAIGYHFQASLSNTFSTLYYNDSTLVNTSRTFGPFNGTTTYYWRVRAKSAVGWSDWSEVRSFTTRSIGLPPLNGTRWIFNRTLTEKKIPGGEVGIAVDPLGRIWVASHPLAPAESLYAGGQYVKTRALYVFLPNGTQAPFSPITQITVGGITDTLLIASPTTNKTGYVDRDLEGNILYVYDDAIFKLDYKTGAGLNKARPNPTVPIGNTVIDTTGRIFLTYAMQVPNRDVLDKNLNYLKSLSFPANVFNTMVAVSKDAKDLFLTAPVGLARLHSDNGIDGSYTAVDTIVKMLRSGRSTWHPKTGLLWMGSGNAGNPPDVPYTRETYYAINVLTNQIVDTLAWYTTQNILVGGPNRIAFTINGDTAYVAHAGLDSAYIQMFLPAKPVYPPPASWTFRSVTGKNGTVGIQSTINPKIGVQPIKNGDAIGAFFIRNDSVLCAGYAIWETGQNVALTIWGDDDQTPMKDGFDDSEHIKFKVWDSEKAVDYPAVATYLAGGGLTTSGLYLTNGLYQLATFTGITSVAHSIRLPQGWNMISSFVTPKDSTLDSIYVKIKPRMVIAKNGLGQVYWPAFTINSIGKWKYYHGYQIYMQATDTVTVFGEEINPTVKPLVMPQGWNMISYLRNSPMRSDTALASLDSGLVIAKNNAGQVYWPSFAINTIGSMKPGQGYQMYLKSARTLTYPQNLAPAPPTVLTKGVLIAEEESKTEPQHYRIAYTATGTSAILGIEKRELNDGDELAVWTSDYRLVGSTVVKNQKAVIAIWGDDEMTEEVKEGAVEGEKLSLTVWRRSDGKEEPLNVSSITDALTGELRKDGLLFRRDAVYSMTAVNEQLIPTIFSLDQNYPNPFNPSTTIRYGLPKDVKVSLDVYDLLGRKVATLVNTEQKAGYYSVVFQNRSFSSGVYIYRISAGEYKASKKFVLIK